MCVLPCPAGGRAEDKASQYRERGPPSAPVEIFIIIIIFRYCAVCHPFYYRDAVLASSVKFRVAKYVIPVVVFAIVLNIPKFFETEIFYIPVNETVFDKTSQANDDVHYILTYDVTELRKDPDYIR